MRPIETQSLTATCLHPQTGSSKVYANNLGVSRVGVDNAGGGIIMGPGSSRVYVEGSQVSLTNDRIAPHPCCGSPGCSPHCAARTNPTGEPLVMVGA